jgi:large subunit ribosomal protein L4
LKNLKICEKQKLLIILSQRNKNLFLASRNIKNVNVCLTSNLNILNLLKVNRILITETAFNEIREVYCA